MIIVVGSALDPVAVEFADGGASGSALLVEADDLSAPGWCLDPQAPEATRIVAGGHVVDMAEISGIVVRRPAVFPQELLHIDPIDRSYVAAEMTAFLRCWLALVPVPVLNRPTAVCLGGAGWRASQWRKAARRCGFHITIGHADVVELAVVSGKVLGAASDATGAFARALARAAGVELLALTVAFDEDRVCLVSADPWPDLRRRPLADEVRKALT